MSFKKFLGTIVGGGIGFVVGGPAGAIKGAQLGMGVDAARATISAGKENAAAVTSAAETANTAAQADIDLRRRMYEESVARQQPFYQAGVNALPGYLSGIGQGGELVRGFTQADYQADPGYAFRMSEGMKGLERSAAARGGLLSGATMKGIQRFGQDLASQEYSNAYNRFRDTQGLRRNALAGVVGYGPTSANQMTASGQDYASGAGPQMYQQGVNTGNALIAGNQARSSAYSDVFGTLGKYLGGNSLGNFGSGIGTNTYSGQGPTGYSP